MTATTRPSAAGGARRCASSSRRSATIMAKELRSRMRGRRAFIVLTVYLGLLALIAYGAYAGRRADRARGGREGSASASSRRTPRPSSGSRSSRCSRSSRSSSSPSSRPLHRRPDQPGAREADPGPADQHAPASRRDRDRQARDGPRLRGADDRCGRADQRHRAHVRRGGGRGHRPPAARPARRRPSASARSGIFASALMKRTQAATVLTYSVVIGCILGTRHAVRLLAGDRPDATTPSRCVPMAARLKSFASSTRWSPCSTWSPASSRPAAAGSHQPLVPDLRHRHRGWHPDGRRRLRGRRTACGRPRTRLSADRLLVATHLDHVPGAGSCPDADLDAPGRARPDAVGLPPSCQAGRAGARPMSDRLVADAIRERLGPDALGRLRSLRRRLWTRRAARTGVVALAMAAVGIAIVQLLARAFPIEAAGGSRRRSSPSPSAGGWRASCVIVRPSSKPPDARTRSSTCGSAWEPRSSWPAIRPTTRSRPDSSRTPAPS